MHPVEMFPRHHHQIDNHHHGTTTTSRDNPRKRVARACDRCRLKKGKCDGREQCQKCVGADVMCIYTDRKPPQQKQISPQLAEALQSENFTLKKAMIAIFKELMAARGKPPPAIDGVDWNSDKVANGKSGRALTYIILDEAKIDNRISNEEISDYNSADPSLDITNSNSPSASSSPKHLSPMATPEYETIPLESPPKKRKASPKYHEHQHIRTGSYIEPSMLTCPPPAQPAPLTGLYPPTPPTTDDAWSSTESLLPQFPQVQDFYGLGPVQAQQPQQQSWSAHQQHHTQPEYYGEQFLSSIDMDNNRGRQVYPAESLIYG